MARSIEKVLIANRGEIAVRIARACAERRIASVAVVSEADRESFHARVADRVVEIGPAPAAGSYLDGQKILEAARATGADAVHPGYGFLAENADFADAVVEAGLVWIGPSAAAIRATGLKTAARSTMEAAGVPVVPGYQGAGDESLETLSAEAKKVGLPLLVKAAAGGGGKGMRIVRSAAELAGALEAARGEATRAFGDGRLFLERYLEDARHVEIQILADDRGNTVHLFERECSVQRRYQKVVEESPSPAVDDDLRRRMGEAAVAAARAVGYASAGTVEFLLAPDGSFFFLEMNTRLQVEHPVTEVVTGVDLVGAQLDVAAGRPLPFAQGDLVGRGHAIEVRLYAEDPAAGFAPSTGTVHRIEFGSGPGIRVDAGVETGDRIPVYYDPMIAKIIAGAADRERAIGRLEAALARTIVLGVRTNLAHLQAILAHPTFREGRATTRFLETEMADWAPAGQPPVEALLAAALADRSRAAVGAGPAGGVGPGDPFSPWSRADGFRLGGR